MRRQRLCAEKVSGAQGRPLSSQHTRSWRSATPGADGAVCADSCLGCRQPMNVPTLETRAEEAADMDMSRERYMRRVEREPAMAIALEMTIGLVVAVLAGVAIVLLGGF